MRRLAICCAAVLLLAAGCDETTKESSEPDPTISAVKTDCPDCDPAGPNAFVQTGVGDGFYAKGDHWQVAYRFTSSPAAEKRAGIFLAEDLAPSEVYLFNYEVLGTDRDVFANVLRDTATIEITQAIPPAANEDLFSLARLDEFEKRVVFSLNDLLDPIAETIYSRDYPHGKRIELDSKSSLKSGASVFPRTIPRLLVHNQVDSPAPEVHADLVPVLDAMDADWASRSYTKITFENGDVVYWAKGDKLFWPFYVETRASAAVLVSWN